MKNKTKNILCKNTKFGHNLWIKCHYAELKSLFQKTINTTAGQASTNSNPSFKSALNIFQQNL